jgi:6-phosphogluconolactonase
MKFPSFLRYSCWIVLLTAGCSLPARDFWVYLGTFTEGSSKGIYVSRLDANTGELSDPKLAVATPDPSYLALAPDQKHLYADNEVNAGMVSAFSINPMSGELKLLNQKDSGGSGPCHVSVDLSGQTLLVANYGSGSIKSMPILSDGRLGDGGTTIQYQGRGTNPIRQTGPHGHYLGVDPSNRFALGCDLGTDRIMVYRLDAANGIMTTNDVPFGVVPPGSGPRHLVFSRDGKSVYVIDEMACKITCFNWDNQTGILARRASISVLPHGETVQPDYTAAEILLHPSGRFVYVTLRGHDSISVFAVDAATGSLALIQNLPSGGKAPRGMAIDPTGHWLFTGNQKTDNAVEFAIDPASGKLTPTKLQLQVGSPVDFKFVPVD